MHKQSCCFCLSATNTSPVPQCRSLNSKRGDATTEAVGSVPSQRCWQCLSACSRGTSGNVLHSDSWAWQQLPQQHNLFLRIGQMQVSSQDSSLPRLCCCTSADWKGRTGPLSASPSTGALPAAILAPALQTLPCPCPQLGCDSRSPQLCVPANTSSQCFHPVLNGQLQR